MFENENFPSLSIEKIEFKNHDDVFKFNEDDIVLFVGANNVGKSRTLKDIQSKILSDFQDETVLIDNIVFKEINFCAKKILNFIDQYLKLSPSGNYNLILDDRECIFYSHELESLNTNNISDFSKFHKLFYTFLSTENRLNLTKPYKINISNNNKTLDIINKLRIQQDSKIKSNFET